MKKEQFALLLEDLYKAYNPDFIQYIPELVEKYHRTELDSISTILLKYNHKSKPWFDESKNTDEYKFQLIKDYSNNKRTLENFTPVPAAPKVEINLEDEQNKLKNQIDNKLESIDKEVKGQIDLQEKKANEIIKNIEDTIQKEIAKFKNALAEHIKNAENYTNQRKELFDDVELTSSILNYEKKVDLPPLNELVCMGVGARIVVRDEDKRPVGLEIKDILYDYASFEVTGKPTIEISLEKQ